MTNTHPSAAEAFALAVAEAFPANVLVDDTESLLHRYRATKNRTRLTPEQLRERRQLQAKRQRRVKAKRKAARQARKVARRRS